MRTSFLPYRILLSKSYFGTYHVDDDNLSRYLLTLALYKCLDIELTCRKVDAGSVIKLYDRLR